MKIYVYSCLFLGGGGKESISKSDASEVARSYRGKRMERRSESAEFAGCPNLSPRPARTALHRGSVTRGSRLPLGVIWPLRISEQRSGQHAPTGRRRRRVTQAGDEKPAASERKRNRLFIARQTSRPGEEVVWGG